MAKSKFISFPLLFLMTVLAAVLIYTNWPANQQGQQQHKRVIAVKTIEVTKADFRDVVEALGTARANEQVLITSKISDFVENVYFDDGQRVNQGFVLLELSDIEEQAKVKELRANLAEAKAQLQRFTDLIKRNAAAQSQVDEQDAKVKAIAAQLESARAKLTDLTITAPFTGVLGQREISRGAYVNSGDVITTLDDISVIKVDFNVPERYLPTISIGQTIDALNTAYSGEKFQGKVFSIGSRIDAMTRTVQVRAKIDNTEQKLRPGMLMGVQIERQVDNVILLPESAIIPIEDKHYVYAVEGDKATRLTVELGRRNPGFVEIVSGLVEGQQIVIEGALKLKPGADVRVLEPSA